ncbi:hypothetical protein Ahia01_000240300 [Argonauta hians]
MQRSQLQCQVLSLYRRLLRASRCKPGFKSYIDAEFRRHRDIPRAHTLRIEHLLRNGNRKLELLQRREVQSLGVFYKEEEEEEEEEKKVVVGVKGEKEKEKEKK